MITSLTLLIGHHTVPQNLIVSHRVLVHPAAVAGVALHGVDDPVLDLPDDTHVVGLPVLRAGVTLVVPVEEDNHAGRRLDGVIRPLATVSEPLDAVDATCEFGNDTGVDVAALVGAPGNKAGAPIHPALEAIPGPIGPTAYIAELGESHRYDLPITCANAV